MYIHSGNNLVVNTKDIIGIFDLDNTTVSVRGREFLPRAQENGQIINATEELPVSYVVTSYKNKNKVYLSSLSSKVLSGRAKKVRMSLGKGELIYERD